MLTLSFFFRSPNRRRNDGPNRACQRLREVPRVESLEGRSLPSVVLNQTFSGLNFGDTAGFVPPDTIAAAGPTHVVECVNTNLAVYNKTNGSLVSKQSLGSFFNTFDSLSDPNVTYDELASKFFVTVLDIDQDALLYGRFSDSSGDPTSGAETGQIPVTDFGGLIGVTVGDFPRVGWNADAYVVSLNMFDPFFGIYDHVQVVTIPKANFFNPTTTDPFGINDFAGNNFTLAPATMHGSQAGDPMWFVEEANYENGKNIRVVEETGVLTSPSFTSFDIGVASYTAPPDATQSGSSNKITTNDSRILNVEWRTNKLVASQAVGLSTDAQAHARWYEFSTAGASPSLTQQGTIGAGSGANSYFPSVAINSKGDVGMTFMESSSSEFMSVYVTGATFSSTSFAMTMQTPVVAKAGLARYASFDSPPYRAGDFSGISVDANDSFWAANEYATGNTSASANWGTWIANFSLTAAASLPIGPGPSAAVSGTQQTGATAFDLLGTDPPDFTKPSGINVGGPGLHSASPSLAGLIEAESSVYVSAFINSIIDAQPGGADGPLPPNDSLSAWIANLPPGLILDQPQLAPGGAN
jgi:hypothetical protein